jgi:hypothetical protein
MFRFLYEWSIIISKNNTERINGSVPSQQDFQNSGVLNERGNVGVLIIQKFTSSQFHFLIVGELANSKVSL